MTKFRVLGMILIVISVLLLTSCADVAGTWENEDGNATVVFKDGMITNSSGMDSPYTFRDGKLTIEDPDISDSSQRTYGVTFSGDKMTLSQGDYKVVLVRRSGSASSGGLVVAIVLPSVFAAVVAAALIIRNKRKRLAAQAEAAAYYAYGYAYPANQTAQQNRYCTGCGAQIPGQAGFCPKCGKSV